MKQISKTITTIGFVLSAAGILHAEAGPSKTYSSHNDAPLIKQDPQANLTDVYAFIGSAHDDPAAEVLNVVVNLRPFSEPGDGPHYERFAPDALYSIHVADPSSGASLIRYDFEFTAVDAGVKNANTILSYGLGTEAGPVLTLDDARQNFTQRYSVTRRTPEGHALVLDDGIVGIPNVGSNVTPLYNDTQGRAVSGAETPATLDPYTAQAVFSGHNGESIFAGPRDDSFYADIPGVFDLLNFRIIDNTGTLDDGIGQDGDGIDGFKGFNVLTFAIQIPLTELPQLAYNDAFFGPQSGIGVFASVSRRAQTTRIAGNHVVNSGPWIQVNRLGNPLFNEALVALSDKDRYNASDPQNDAQFAGYASDPELASLLNIVFGTGFETTARDDLVAVFIPDVLRVATTTGPVPLTGEPGFSRFGFVGGDTTGGVSSGWPNGRRFGDDVIDIALTAIASGPSYTEITVVGDNVTENDIAFNRVFPYAATPHAGTLNRKDMLSDAERADINEDGVATPADFNAYIILIRSVLGL